MKTHDNTLINTIRSQLEHTLKETNFVGLGELYRGKVRDVYKTKERIISITTDRVSAFDRVLGTIPFKGEILNRMAADGFERTQDIVPNHVISIPDPNILVAKTCRPYPVEFVVRGHITGSLWRDYQSGKASAYGIPFAKDLKKDQKFDCVVLTPTTKAEIGQHDEPISEEEIMKRGLLSAENWEEAKAAALALFARGEARARERGRILVDTKYELGRDAQDVLTVIDEIHTPDSSRYWIREEYESRFERGEAQRMLDKENLRGWLLEKGFSGDGPAPALTDEIRTQLALSYVDAADYMTGERYSLEAGPVEDRIRQNLISAGLVLRDSLRF